MDIIGRESELGREAAPEQVSGGTQLENMLKSSIESGVDSEMTVEQSQLESQEAYAKIIAKVNPQQRTYNAESLGQDAQNLSQQANSESMVNYLVNIAQDPKKGVFHAVQTAKKVSDDYAIDRLHDILKDDFHDALVANGLIEAD